MPLWVLLGALGVVLLLPAVTRDLTARATLWAFGLVSWLQLPRFFCWMYWMNHGSAVWLASVACMIVIYYHLTDWRLATLGLASGMALSFVLAQPPPPLAGVDPSASPEHVAVLGFAWVCALLLGASSANLRCIRLANTQSTLAVMAHELRTPLATVNLMGDVLRTLARNDLSENKRRKIEDLASRLQHLVRGMHQQIDTPICNAQLMRLRREKSALQAAALVSEVVENYPYRSSSERDYQRIFEPFFSSPSGAGHGLGLAFCKHVVEAARGSFTVHAEPEVGAVFVIDLPLHTH